VSDSESELRLPQMRALGALGEEGIVNKQFGLAVVLGLFVVGRGPVNGQSIDTVAIPRITVVVCDKARVSPDELSIGLNEASRIMRSAGVDVRWIHSVDMTKLPATFNLSSLEGCELPQIDHDFMIVIAAETPRGRNPDVMGHANSTGNYPRAYVLYRRVRAFVDNHGNRNSAITDEGNILGHVIAHELGHLLMPEKPHSIGGIMSANWGETEWHDAIQGGLLFSPSQAKLIQSYSSPGLKTAAIRK
jgi:hypothetical protein